MLAVLPAITALAGVTLRLSPRRDVEVDVSPCLASKDTWYLKTDQTHGLKYFNRVPSGGDLTEKSLERMLEQIRKNVTGPGIKVQPTKLIVHPKMVDDAWRVLTHRPTLLERLLWRLFPVD